MPAARKTAAAKITTRKTATRKTAAKKTPARKTPSKAAASSEQEKRPAPGRPPLLEVDPELQGRIVAYVRAGAFPERAAVAAGVSERSHYAWIAVGRTEQDAREDGHEPDDTLDMYVTYAAAIERAVAEAEIALMGTALKGGPSGNASQTILERRFRDRWGMKAPLAPPAPPAAPAATPVTGLDMLEQKRRAREQTTH